MTHLVNRIKLKFKSPWLKYHYTIFLPGTKYCILYSKTNLKNYTMNCRKVSQFKSYHLYLKNLASSEQYLYLKSSLVDTDSEFLRQLWYKTFLYLIHKLWTLKNLTKFLNIVFQHKLSLELRYSNKNKNSSDNNSILTDYIFMFWVISTFCIYVSSL